MGFSQCVTKSCVNETCPLLEGRRFGGGTGRTLWILRTAQRRPHSTHTHTGPRSHKHKQQQKLTSRCAAAPQTRCPRCCLYVLACVRAVMRCVCLAGGLAGWGAGERAEWQTGETGEYSNPR